MTDQEGAAMTPDIVTEARELLDAATPGPWEVSPDRTGVNAGATVPVCSVWDRHKSNGEFIAAAPQLVTDLVAEVERLRHAVAQDCCGTDFWPELRDGGDQ